MNKTIILISFILLNIVNGFGQDIIFSDFIPKGYIEYDKCFGDLNKDGLKDCVLMIKKVDTTHVIINRFGNKVDRNRRGVIILFRNKNGFQIVDENYDCFLSENEDGGLYYPPQLSVEIKMNSLLFNYEHGRYGFWNYEFQFQDTNFVLTEYESSNNRGPIVESELHINFLTKIKSTKVNISQDEEVEDEVLEETRNSIELDHLIRLSEIKYFEGLEMYNY